jgi:hypothetical protein
MKFNNKLRGDLFQINSLNLKSFSKHTYKKFNFVIYSFLFLFEL